MQEFLEKITAKMEERAGDGYEVRTEPVLKNNGVERMGLLFFPKGGTVGPTIYLNEYYEEYANGRELNDIADEIMRCLDRCMERGMPFGSIQALSFESVSSKIFYRLVNRRENERLLEKIPHIPFLDLAITFACALERERGMIGTMHVSDDLMGHWGIDRETLVGLARANTPRLFPAQIFTMEEIIEEMMREEMDKLSFCRERGLAGEEDLSRARKCCMDIRSTVRKSGQIPMYVLTNDARANGAAALLYEGILSEFARECGEDFYILPSSIHEVILVPRSLGPGEEELRGMVREVNRTQVEREELLSNHVYLYRQEGDCVECEGREEPLPFRGRDGAE